MEKDELESRIKRKIRENIALSNLKHELVKKKRRNRSIFCSILLVGIICSVVAINQNYPETDDEMNQVQQQMNISKKEEQIQINTIENLVEVSKDMDGKWIDADVIEEFDFFSSIKLPEAVKEIKRQGKVYVRENENLEYSKLNEYVIMYDGDVRASSKSTLERIREPSIKIYFSVPGQQLLNECIRTEAEPKESVLNNIPVYIFMSGTIEDGSNRKGIATFEYQDVQFRIQTEQVSQEELLTLIRSIIQ